MRVSAFVPMRHQSERVPGKNYRSFGGSPLFTHVISTLLQCHSIDDVVVDTDSPTIKRALERDFPRVLVIDRPEHLLGGHVPMTDVLCYDATTVPCDIVVQTHSTNPLIRPWTIDQAIKRYVDGCPNHDSLFAVTKIQERLWDDGSRPINHDLKVLLRTQDLDPIFVENSCLYIISRQLLLATNNRIGSRPLMFEMDRLEAQDIDEEHDFLIAEAIYAQLDRRKEAA